MGLKSENDQKRSMPVKSASRAIEILEILAARGGVPARLIDLAEELDAPRSSVHALVRTLGNMGWIRTDITGTTYTLGLRCLLIGTSILDSDPYVRVARPILSDLRDHLGETVHLGRIEQDEIVYLATFEGGKETRPFTRDGRAMPTHCTSLGKALLAARGELPNPPLEPLTPQTITNIDTLKAELNEARIQGFAFDREENTSGISCVGVPLKHTTPVSDAISCSVPVARMTTTHSDKITAALLDAAEKIEQSAPVQGAI